MALGERIVRVWSGNGPGARLLGTGTYVGRERVLTARHMVWHDGAEVAGLHVELEQGDGGAKPARVVWPPPGAAPDVAVLCAALGCPELDPLTLLSARPLRAGESWEAEGYPAIRDVGPSQRLEKVGGVTRSWASREPHVFLDVTTNPKVWGGLSGAAVAVEDRIVAIVRAEPHGWDGRRIEATPVGAFLHDPAFLEALQVPPRSAENARRLEQLEEELIATIRRHDGLAAGLASALDLGPDASVASIVSAVLRQVPTPKVARALDHYHKSLIGAERRALRDVLFAALPLTADWHAPAREVRAGCHSGRSDFELDVRYATIAECIMAGADLRTLCLDGFDLRTALGKTAVRLPPEPPLFGAGDLVAQKVVDTLAQQHGLGGSDPEARRKALEAFLAFEVNGAAPGEGRPYYLLFIDEEDGAQHAADRWDAVKASFQRYLPSLRLVRLRGTTSSAQEITVSRHILAVLRREDDPDGPRR